MFLISGKMLKKTWDLENVQLLPLEIQISSFFLGNSKKAFGNFINIENNKPYISLPLCDGLVSEKV